MLTHIYQMPSTYHVCRMALSPLTYFNTFFIGCFYRARFSLSPCLPQGFHGCSGYPAHQGRRPRGCGELQLLRWQRAGLGRASHHPGVHRYPLRAQSCRRRDLLSHLAVPWPPAGTLRHASYGMGLSVMEGVGGQLPGLRAPLRVNGTTPNAAGSHQSRLSPRGTEPPAILAVTPSLKALVGEDVTLECWVLGVPPPHIVWYKGETGTDLGSEPPPCTRGPPAPCRDIARRVPWTDGGRDPQRHSGH